MTLSAQLEARANAIADYDRSLSGRLFVLAMEVDRLETEVERLRTENAELRAATTNCPEMVP